MTNISTRLSGLSTKKLKLLAERLKKSEEVSSDTIKRQPRDTNIFPLSFEQKRLWFIDQLEPGNPAYNNSMAVRFNCDAREVEESLNDVILRHEVLRSSFPIVDGQPVQMIAPALRLKPELIDLRGLPAREREKIAGELLAREAQRPFNLTTGPLIRAKVLLLDEGDHLLVCTQHHTVSDGFSVSILQKEIIYFQSFYHRLKQNDAPEFDSCLGAMARGKHSRLPELPIQYADYTVWQVERLQGEALDGLMAYWKKQLAGLPALNLPTDRPRLAVGGSRGARQSVALSGELATELNRLSQREGVTLFMTLLAAFKVLLYRYSGQDDIVVGSPIAGRNRKEAENLLGFFVNMLVLRTNVGRSLSFKEMLSRVKDVCLGAYAHQEMPFAELVKELNPERDLDRHPLFQVGFQLNNTPSSFDMQTVEGGVPVRGPMQGMWLDTKRAIFDLHLTIDRMSSIGQLGEGGFRCVLEYDTGLFEAQTVRRMINHFERLLRKVVEVVDQSLEEIEILTEDEKRLLLTEWNETTQYPKDKCIQELIEEQAERAADRIALAYEDRQVTYAELNRRANQLGHYLRSKGVGAEVVVGICVERSVEMVVGLLGILKAGGAYLPIEPDYPAERIAYMLEDSNATVLLTKDALAQFLPYKPRTIICLDKEQQEIERGRADNPTKETEAQNLAYVIYTSGSTGKPKGVLIEHAQVARLLEATSQWYGFGPEDVWTMLHSYAFDFSVWEIWGALSYGGQVIVAPNEVRRNPLAVYELLSEAGVTVLNQTPSAFKQLSEVDESMGASDRLSLRLVIFGGEALEIGSLRGWFERHGDVKPALVNMYGITETTVHVTYRPIRAEEARTETRSVIGRRIQDLKMYVLDEIKQAVPIGVSGEAYVGGAGLARGYLGKADLTAERFVPNGYGSEAGERMYRTGDLARYRADGEIEYIGRADDQVKVRGYRIELGEIEAALREHESIAECVVVIREMGEGERRLVGYVVSKGSAEVSVSEMRSHLKRKLPEHMVPAGFVVMERMPLTQNGKIDRRALPAVDLTRPHLESDFEEPRNATERMLADIWASVLRLDKVGIHDNYFELGGDSILSIQIIFKANQAGLQLSPRQIFQNQTIAELAAIAGTARIIEVEQSLVQGPVPLTPIQRWFFEQELADAHHYNQAVMLKVSEDIETGLLKKVLEEIVDHHDALRLRFYQQDGKWEQNNSVREEGQIFLEIDLSGMGDKEQAQAMKEATTRIQASLNLQEGPLMKAALMNLGEEGGKRLLMVIHHLAVDGMSWRILLDDMRKGYEQATRGQIDLGRKTTSYKQWAERLIEYARGEDLKAEASYWIGQNRADAQRIPLDYEVGENSVESARNVMVWLSEEETRALLQDVPAAYRTQINDGLLTALALAYREWTGRASVLIDLEGHGREEIIEGADITRTVGWFTSIYPVVLELRESLGLGEELKQVKEQLRGIPNKGIGYGLLKYLSEEEEVRSKLSEGQEPEIVFNYLGQMGQTAGQGGPFKLSREGAGTVRSSRQRRRHVLEVNGAVIAGRLQMNWTYSENLHRRETIEALAEAYRKWLKAIIDHCTSTDAAGYTPSDFPLSGLNQEQLDKLVGGDRNIEDIYKLSAMQQGLLFHSLYNPAGGAYIVQMSIVMEGDVSKEEYERMWQGVAEKNDVMRSSFMWEGVDEPVQVVRKRVKVPVEYMDWRGKSSLEQQKELESYLREDRKRGFDLREAPLMRICVIRKAENVHQWIWSHHHILMDGWSMPIVLSQLSATTDEAGSGRPYRDYIEWLQKQDLGKAESYWRENLRGFREPTRVGIEKLADGSAEQEGGHAEEIIRLKKAVSDKLERVAREQRLTVNTLVQGAWALLLSRYSGGKDVLYGATVSGRPADLPGIDKVVGVFINTLPVRVKVRAEERVGDWLKRLQEQQAEMRQYEYSPLMQVQGWSDVPRGEALFESIFAYENYPMLRSLQERSGGSKVREMRAIERTNYPLSIVAMPGSELQIKIIYDRGQYKETAIRRMIKHYETVLESFAQGVDQRVSEIDILTADERRLLLTEWNDTAAEYPKDKCAQELIEEQAERAADRIALVYEDQQVTYAELNRRANQLGHYLRSKGVGAEVVVGICVERSVEMVVGLLGILKAGGAYLPLDPQYPMQRLTYMLDDARVKLLVTTDALLKELDGIERQVILLDSDWEQIAEQSEQNLERRTDPRNTAYVIYTSGSTGEPKGVMVEHRGLSNMAEAQMKSFGVTSNSCALQFASLSFDASIFEIIMGQRAGARLCLAAKESLLPGPDLVELLRSQSVTHVTIPPSALSLVPEERMPELETIIVAGEACSEDLAARWGRDRKFFNAYGPTEATVWSSVLQCEGRGAPTIGRPISNVQLYILDEDCNPVPTGARGEIYIAGDGLARGYIGRADMTAERFIPNAYGREAGARLYKTGDLGRYRADGEIEYIGRADDQVKVRGYRIELGEIEAALREHESIAECVVVIREMGEGERRLVGYVVSKGSAEVSVSEMRSHLKRKLPEHMMPAGFVVMERMPLTQNGKIDRRALPDAKDHGLRLAEVYAPPRNEAEGIIAAIWQEILKVDRVGINDNFFDLGGHSLSMIKMHNRLQTAFNTSVPMIEMFRHPTVRGMAAHLSNSQNQDTSFVRGQGRAEIRKKLARRQKQSR